MRFFSAVLVTETSIVRSSRSCAVAHLFQQRRPRLAARSRWPACCGESGCGSSRSAWAEAISSAAVEQRNLAHLHQVHADRVVDADARSADDFVELGFGFRLVGRGIGSDFGSSSSSKAVELRVDGVDVGDQRRTSSTSSRSPPRPGDFLLLRSIACGLAAAVRGESWRSAGGVLASRGFSGVLGQRHTPRCRTGLQSGGRRFGRQKKQFECQGSRRIGAHRGKS